MTELNFDKVGEIVKEYDFLLGCEGLHLPNYKVLIDPGQGVGFSTKDKKTLEAMAKIPSGKSMVLLNRLHDLAKNLDEDYLLPRDIFYESP